MTNIATGGTFEGNPVSSSANIWVTVGSFIVFFTLYCKTQFIKLPSALFCKRQDKTLKIQNIYFENVFIREKKQETKSKPYKLFGY